MQDMMHDTPAAVLTMLLYLLLAPMLLLASPKPVVRPVAADVPVGVLEAMAV